MSRKMLMAAKTASKNNKKQKQRLIKKAGKLSPEDLERIAVLKRCGLYEDAGEAESAEKDDAASSSDNPKGIKAGPSEAEKKRPKLAKTLESLAMSNPILQEIGVSTIAQTKSDRSSSAMGARNAATGKKTGPLLLGGRARLTRGPSGVFSEEGSQQDHERDA